MTERPPDAPDASPDPEDPARPSLAGLVVVAALVLFGGVLLLANFTGETADPAEGPKPDALFGKGKAKARGKARSRAPRPEKALRHEAVPASQPAPPEGAKNLVLVTVAALRKDALDPYGSELGLTPRLAALAGSGARFADMISASPFSRTAAVSWMSGRWAAELDAVEPRDGANHRPLVDEATTLAEILSDAGWRTYGVTANFNLNWDTGYAQGFHHYRDAQPLGFSLGQRTDAEDVVRIGLEWLTERSDEERQRPFYLQLALVDPHIPLRSPDDAGVALPDDVERPAYRAAVARVDRAVGTLLEGLEAMGHDLDDTVVVFQASHGEGLEMPEHHGKFHGWLLYPTSVEVPWIVAGPSVEANHLVGGLASHLDVMPTVVSLLGLTPPDGIEGRSWAAQVRGEQARTTRERAFSDTWYFQADRASVWTADRQCQKDFGSAAKVDDSFADGCYDRRTDPQFTNLIEDEALMAELDAFRARFEGLVTTEGPVARTADDAGEQEVAAGDEE